MFNEDNNGFVNFPQESNTIYKIDTGKTLVYIACFEVDDTKDPKMSNINLFQPGSFVADDVIVRPSLENDDISINNRNQDFYDSIYFPNLTSRDKIKKFMSIDLISCVCIGWINATYEYKNEIKFWNAGFRDLTHEGKNLYYSIRKLHNNKEVRILTFNNV